MQFSHMSSNSLIQSIVQSSFKRSINELGLPDLSEEAFCKDISAFLRVPNSLFEDTPRTRKELWLATLRGKVIAAETSNNLAFIFYVQGSLRGRGINIRLVCESQTWHIDDVLSMYTQKVARTRWFQSSVFTGALIIAGFFGYMLHGSHLEASDRMTGNDTSTHRIARTVQQPVTGLKQTSIQSNSTSSQGKQEAKTTKQPVSSKPVPQQLSFNLREGMSLDDLSQFLKSHHLIRSAISFDMVMKNTKADRDAKPGIYHFTTDMTQQQLIATIKQGPSKT